MSTNINDLLEDHLYSGNVKEISYLLDLVTEYDKQCLLSLAMMINEKEIVELLLSKNISLPSEDNDGITLELCLESGHIDVILQYLKVRKITPEANISLTNGLKKIQLAQEENFALRILMDESTDWSLQE